MYFPDPSDMMRMVQFDQPPFLAAAESPGIELVNPNSGSGLLDLLEISGIFVSENFVINLPSIPTVER